MTAAEYGTLLHEILENIDYSECYENTERYIAKLVNNTIRKLKKSVSEEILMKIKNQIYRYLYSEIKELVSGDVKIYKEQPFVLYENLPQKLYKSINADKVYIQGIVDLYLETKEYGNILVDFKTDRLNSKEELIRRYEIQLDMYKRGIEKGTKKSLNHIYIYSFELNELIEIDK